MKKIFIAVVLIILIAFFFCWPRHIKMSSDVSEKMTIMFTDPILEDGHIPLITESYVIDVDNSQYEPIKSIFTNTKLYPRMKDIYSRKLQEVGWDWVVTIYFARNEIYIFSTGKVSYSKLESDNYNFRYMHLGFNKENKAEDIKQIIYNLVNSSNLQD